MTDSPPTVTLESPAKVNLSLTIGPLRPDGYHAIESLAVPLSLADTVTVTLTPTPRTGLVSCDRPDVPVDATNLALKAVSAFRGATGLESGVTIEITKRIPVAAGLGGGSSNAAATLVALARLVDTAVPDDVLIDCAASIGSDVPLFVQVLRQGGTVQMAGRGEVVTPGPEIPPWSYLVAHPGFPVSTAWAYEAYDAQLTNQGGASTVRATTADGFTLINHLESVTFARYPGLETLRDAMLGEGAVGALLAGSGATVVGLFPAPTAAEAARRALAERDWRRVFTPWDTAAPTAVWPGPMWWTVAHTYGIRT